MLQQIIQLASFETLFKPVLILAVTIALIWFLRPGFFIGALLAIAGFILAVISSVVLQLALGALYFAVFLSIFVAGDQVADVPGQPSSIRAEIYYRVDVNLLVDGQPLTGSVVQEAIIVQGGVDRFYGHALVLDLPGGRPSLIVPMAMADISRGGAVDLNSEKPFPGRRENAYSRMFFEVCGFYTLQGQERRVGFSLGDAEDNAQWFGWLNSFKGSCDIAPEFMPVFLSISDKNDPDTIFQVDPDNLSARFGPGVEFVSASVNIVDGPVSDYMFTMLPWAAELYESIGPKSRTIFADSFDINVRPDNMPLLINSLIIEEIK